MFSVQADYVLGPLRLAIETAKCPSDRKTDTKYDEGQQGHRSVPSGRGLRSGVAEDLWL